MKRSEKDDIIIRLAVCLNRTITANKLIAKANKAEGKQVLKLVTSIRQLEAASGVNFATIQRISAGAKNASFSTIVALADGLGMSPSEFLSYYTVVTPDEVNEFSRKKKQSKSSKS